MKGLSRVINKIKMCQSDNHYISSSELLKGFRLNLVLEVFIEIWFVTDQYSPCFALS